MSTPAAARKYPYEVVDGQVMIQPANLFELMAEPDWSEETKVSDTMAEYMRRAAIESGEPEIVHLDATKPIQLRWTMRNSTPEQLASAVAQLQTMGIAASVTVQPATVQQIRETCDRICALAERMAEQNEEQQADPLGPFLDQLLALKRQMRNQMHDHQQQQQ